MKWAALAMLLASVQPVANWLRRNPHQAPKVWMLMGFLPFGIGTFHLYMAAISWAGWPGYVKGIEFSVMDALALAVYLTLPRTGSSLPFRLSMVLYFVVVLFSASQASVPMAALFYAWQFARMFLIYAVVAKAAVDERVVSALIAGTAMGLCLQALDAIWERFGHGVLQVGGTLGAQNFLGVIAHFVTFPSMALVLAGIRGWRPMLGPLSGVVIAVLTVSRATIAFEIAGYVGLFALSALRRWTARKAQILTIGVVGACVLTPTVLGSFQARFAKDGTDLYSDNGRDAFKDSASMMISDHPWGVGANNYVIVANTGGYNERAMVPWGTNDTAIVHNVYYLVTAETGYIGLISFVLLILQPMITAFRCGWRNRGDVRGDLLLGFGMSLLIVYVHSYFEWIFVTFPVQYMFALSAGMVAGLAQQLGYWGRSRVTDRARVPGAASLGNVTRN